ncbi:MULTISPECIES: hypothetical protein [unclassified Microbacterium]|uniref:hypothetical protein n=1 Tax=unclassified Microbacterium TaxID=2609290 RepID=UPI00214BBAD9|nr:MULTISPECIES: hypothetical protein [unclassified Microbacterium]MCR2784335.1 hypothetical protein [Microbacterium sp. zg.B96]WIM14839.1 hypothetical protein QNO11_09745 [Microbacterium sp. zg-B96]
MENLSNRASAAIGRVKWVAIVGMLLGAVLLILAIGLEWRGFWGGAVQGTGIGMIAVGAYFWGYGNGLGRAEPVAAWLPSRDDRT